MKTGRLKIFIYLASVFILICNKKENIHVYLIIQYQNEITKNSKMLTKR